MCARGSLLKTNYIMNLKGTEFMSVEMVSLVTFWERSEGQRLAEIFSGGGQASVDDII